MTQKKKPKALILEKNEDIREQTDKVLSQAGWETNCETDYKKALTSLQKEKHSPFALFICSYKLPEMDGDDILKAGKKISPFTQRMMLVPTDDPGTLISAINKAQINACIAYPFKDEDLQDRAKYCYRQFVQAIKRQHLQQVMVHQNKQMFKVAQNLKKKDAAYKKHIEEKKLKMEKLASHTKENLEEDKIDQDFSLAKMLEQKKVIPRADLYFEEFSSLFQRIKTFFNNVASKNGLAPIKIEIKEILEKDEEAFEDTSLLESIQAIAFKEYLGSDKVEEQQAEQSEDDMFDFDFDENEDPLDEFIQLTISKDYVRAHIKKIKAPDEDTVFDLDSLLHYFRKKLITFGIEDDAVLEKWVDEATLEDKPLCIATGVDPIDGENGQVSYYFETEYTNPGKLREDGSIDFRDRGDIPYVRKGELLAEKTPSKEGKAGLSVSGISIPVQNVVDPVFVAGNGVELSESELKITSDLDGQPHVDAMGNITVNPDFLINGDVDFETGNIDFNGNIFVKGTVKEGFEVKGINLTATQVEGAVINLTGDLNVSVGISDSKIRVQGNIRAKYIHNSKIMGFGDATISKEVIDSTIILSGTFINTTGHIIASKIAAKLGIEAGNIGTNSSKPAKLKVGVDEHVIILKKEIDVALEENTKRIKLLKEEKEKKEEEDKASYQKITEFAHIQDRAQLEMKDLKDQLPALEKENDVAGKQKISQKIEDLEKKVADAEQELNLIFSQQDSLANDIESFQNQIDILEKKNKTAKTEKKQLLDWEKKDKPVAKVNVFKKITQDTLIQGTHDSLMIREDAAHCKIVEHIIHEDGQNYYEMSIQELS
ncbi:MAG: DUF342 domain-containing protein [Desulfobacteraceae bacterium]|nr:DUF342 domain-containing protein [Desulfobacteraceae bacterium]